ncbi:calnexin-like isoform X2 [Drosophila guanche]|uniref:calnexin-like isoform X2 n=1 Tax=Drosophila guanche TaxID=7266 RepID=UPI001470C29C|nr:calnexin-like isoform X2 [Drosophila guanche]
MQWKLGGSIAALALLLACNILLSVTADVEFGVDADDFEDGQVEDVQEEAVGADEELVYESPVIEPKKFHFADHFDNVDESSKLWVHSQAKKDDIAEEISKYDGIWSWESPQRIVWAKDKGLVLKSKAKHAAISARLRKQFDFKTEKPLVVQYEVTLQEGQDCGGSYIKLLSAGKETEDLKAFNDKTPYTIMFGPDKCGNDVKLHFIFRHVNPINGTITEKHCNKPKNRLDDLFKDKLPHLYQLVVHPDNSFEIRVDHKIVNEGSLLTDFKPPVNPPAQIDDPNDHKPESWDEREKIPDPTASKPSDWDEDAPPQLPDPDAVMPEDWLEDEPDMIFDPTASKPDDWDAEIDGEWEAPLVDNPVCEKAVGCGKWKAPLIQNPNYKGKWRAPSIDNPNYQGKWSPRKIANPDFFEDLKPFRMTPISAVGLELWSMSSDILFDNLIVTDDVAVARDFAAMSFDIKRRYIDRESKTLWHRLMRRMNYKPGWWALYFLYLLIPASCYIFYLYRRAKEDAAKRAAAQAKKTDAPQPDDAPEEEEESDPSSERAAGDSSKESTPLSASPKKNKKSDLEDNVETKPEETKPEDLPSNEEENKPPPAKRPKRPLGDSLRDAARNGKFFLGNENLTRLWNYSPDNLQACKSEQRNFLPLLETYLESPHDKIDPAFEWRALRLLARQTPHFFTSPSQPSSKISDYLEQVRKRLIRDREPKPTTTVSSNASEQNNGLAAKSTPAESEQEAAMALQEAEPEQDLEVEDTDPVVEEVEEDPGHEKSLMVTAKHIDEVAPLIGEPWMKVGKKIGFTNDELLFYQMEHPTASVACSKMLCTWISEDDDATLENWAYMLEGLEMNQAADAVKAIIEREKSSGSAASTATVVQPQLEDDNDVEVLSD